MTTAQITEQPAPPASAKPRTLGDAIKRLFGKVKKALTGKAAAPKPKRRRRRGEDTRSLFKKLAMKIVAPVARSIFQADFAWFIPPHDLDETQRLIMRQAYRQDDTWQQHGDEPFRDDRSNHLSPRL